MDRPQLFGILLMTAMALLLSHTALGQENSTETTTLEPACPCEQGVCTRNNDSTVSCICDRHWEGANCDQEIARCLEANPCNDENAECFNQTNTLLGFSCSCKFGYYKDEEDGKCKEHLMWPGYSSEGHVNKLLRVSNPQDGYSQHSHSLYPIPFFSHNTYYVLQDDRGFIKLGDVPENSPSGINPLVRSMWTAYPFFIAPYWSDFRFEGGATVYFSQMTLVNTTATRTEMASTLLNYVKTVIRANKDMNSQFDPLEAYSVTWHHVFPRQCSDPYCNDSAIFQIVLATDFQYTYVIITWHQLLSRSYLAGGPEVVVGHSSPDGGFVSLASEVKPKTRVVLPLFASGQPTADPMTCLNSIIAMREERDFSSLTKCPCQEKDIKLDFRFMHTSSESTADRQVYQEKFFSTGGLKQVCYYNSLGLHISNRMTAALPLVLSPGTPSLQKIQKSCCDINPTFCAMFNQELPECRPTPVLKTASGGGNSALYMTTFNGHKYTFNGWGEYILVKSGVIELQARTKRNGATNTTSFSAFAVKVANYASYQIYITSEGLLESSWNGETALDPSVFIENKTVSNRLTITAFGGFLQVDRLGNSNSLAFILTLPVEAPTRGLCGNSDSSDMPVADASEEWRVLNSTVSLFDYTKPTATDFETVNVHEGFTPEVLPMEVSQVLALFTNESKRNMANELCGQNIFCLQEYYLNDNAGGTASVALARSQEMTQMVNNIEKVQPMFQELTFNEARYSPSQIANGISLDITLTSPSSNGINFTLQGSFSEMENVLMEGNKLRMKGLNMTALRGLQYPQSLGIIATDPTTNLSSVFWPRLYLCLCEQDEQCQGYAYQFEDEDGQYGVEGNVIQVACKCWKYSNPRTRFTGRHCEKPLDVCSDCFNETTCDANKTTDFCAVCPKHTEGNGFLCRDIDECSIDNGGCQHICTNTITGAHCSCEAGYMTNGTRCIDINECVDNLNICNTSTKYCFNTPGSYECKCYGDGIGEDCVSAPYIYFLEVQLAPIAGQRWGDIQGSSNMNAMNALKNKLQRAIIEKLTTGSSPIGTVDDLIVEIAGFTNLQQRSRRAVDRSAEIGVDVVVRTKSPITDNMMNSALNLGACQSNCDMAGVFVYSAPQLLPGSELCNVGTVNQCDVQTSRCVTMADRRVMCQCLPGFETAQDPNSCQDINECMTGAHSCSSQSSCTNMYGSYTCSCASGYFWHQTSALCVADACQSNPCQTNWNCHITDSGMSYVCSPKSNSVVSGDDDADDWRTALIVVACVLGAFCLILLVVVICLVMQRRKTLEMDAYSNSRYNDLAGNPRPQGFNKRGSATEMSEQRSRGRNVYDAPGRNGDYTSAYDNRSFSNDRL